MSEPTWRGWVAQVLEQDLATQALTVADLMPEIERLIAAHILTHQIERGTDPWRGPAAPDRYRKRFDETQVKLIWLGEHPPLVILPELDIRLWAQTADFKAKLRSA